MSLRMSRRQLVANARAAVQALADAHPRGMSAHQLAEAIFPGEDPRKAARKAGLVAWWLRNDGKTHTITIYGRKVHVLSEVGQQLARKTGG